MQEVKDILLQNHSIETRKSAFFVDRDGAVNVYASYISALEKVALLNGAAEMIKAFNKVGWPAIVLPNQSGIGQGYFSRATAIAVQARIEALLEQISYWLYVVFLYLALPGSGTDLAAWRKPNPGMLLTAERLFGVPLRSGIIVGNKRTDMQASALAHLRGGFWLTPEQTVDTKIENFPVLWTTDHQQIRPEKLSVFGYEACHDQK